MTTRTIAAAILAGTLSIGLAGCSADSLPAPDQPAATAASSAGVDPGRVSPSLKPLPDVNTTGGAIKDLTLDECATAPGEQTVTGKLKSSQDKKHDFLVTISWTTATGDVMGRGFQVVKGLEPGESEDIKITAKVADGATQCVSGVTYGKIKS